MIGFVCAMIGISKVMTGVRSAMVGFTGAMIDISREVIGVRSAMIGIVCPMTDIINAMTAFGARLVNNGQVVADNSGETIGKDATTPGIGNGLIGVGEMDTLHGAAAQAAS